MIGSAGRLRRRLTWNFCEAVELAGDEGPSIANGRRPGYEAAQLGSSNGRLAREMGILKDRLLSSFMVVVRQQRGNYKWIVNERLIADLVFNSAMRLRWPGLGT